MSAPRRPGDDRRAGSRPGPTDRSTGTRERGAKAGGAKDDAAPKAMSPGRKVRAEGWAKAKPPRDKPGRAKKPGRIGGSKLADRPTPMREDGPRRIAEDRLAPRREASSHKDAPRADRFGKPSALRPERPKRAFGDAARTRAAAPPRASRDERATRMSPPTGTRADDRALHDRGDGSGGRSDTPRPDRAPRGADRHARPAAAPTLRPAYGTPRPLRDDIARPQQPARATHDRTSRPARAPRDDTAPARSARPATAKVGVAGGQPNRAARRAALREAAVPPPGAEPAVTAPSATPSPSPAPEAPFLPGAGKREPQRIAKLLARAGVASRREIERMIDERRIALDGTPLETPATLLTSLQGVTVDGQPVQAPAAARLFLFHKPPGVLTAERDFSGRPTIYDRLPTDLPRVMPVGRLDLNTEGLLLLTNDGEFKRKLELPSTAIPRVYRARAYGDVTQAMLEALSDGVEIEGVRYGPIDANLERRTGANVWIEMRITEGKNREVRRVLEYLGLQVSRLIRVAYGEFVLADLAPGGIVEIRQNDLVAFRQTLR